jgi:nitrogenase molybdenum-iron protein NifN
MSCLTGNNFTATRNACKLCAPLGACLAFRGIEGCLPFLHGSQGCATYIRRYMISHFREPMDIASSSFGEESVVFGGRQNLFDGLNHVIEGYRPKVIGIATTCLAETIGDDVNMYVKEYLSAAQEQAELPYILRASTPSYSGSHADGYQWAVRAIVDQLAVDGPNEKFIGVFPGMVSTISDKQSAASLLDEKFSTAVFRVGLPIGIRQTDKFCKVLENITGRPLPEKHEAERGRLIDCYVDGHKYTFGKEVIIYGEEDFVVGMTAFCAEIGLKPVLCASGGKSGRLKECSVEAAPEVDPETPILEGTDFAEIETAAFNLKPDLLIGNSKGFSLSRKTGIPLIRAGFPIHDRISGPRSLHLGYRGAQRLYDTIVDKLTEMKQEGSSVGYTYI